VDLDSLTKQAKKLVDQRGGVDALKGDAEELKDIVEGRGSAMDKAKKAADTLKDPGQKPAAKRKANLRPEHALG
jgi:hypothetical protein